MTKKFTGEVIKYFGYGTNRDLAMMEHIIGRKDILGEPAKLPGYDVCIQKADQFRTKIPKNSPVPKYSPRDLIMKGWGPKFEMYVSRPNSKGIAYGTIWYITSFELELVREWEIVDYGCQEDAYGIAITKKGEKIPVITQSFLRPKTTPIDRVVKGDNYEPYIWPKKAMLKRADDIRENYLKIIRKIGKNK